MTASSVGLSLTSAQREHLASMGVSVTANGLRSASGAPVSVGLAVAMLAKGPGPSHEGVRAGDFQRGYLTAGHQAQHAQGIGGAPFLAQGAGARPDASDGLSRSDVEDVPASGPGADEDESGDAVKAVVPDPGDFRRRYLTRDHQASSPAITGTPNASHIPGRHPAEPQDFGRGYLMAGHAAPSPGDRPANNPHAPGSPAAQVYESGAAAYGQNQARARADQVAQTGGITSRPAPAMWSPPSALGVDSVPHAIAAGAVRVAPGEGQ